MKDIKIFLKKKKIKGQKKVRDRQNLPKEQKQQLLEYMKSII